MRNKKLYLKKIIQTFVIVLTIFISVVSFNFKNLLTDKTEENISTKMAESKILLTYYSSSIDELKRDTELLSILPVFSDTSEKIVDKQKEIERTFKSFMSVKDSYYQMRIINEKGDEIISATRNQGKIVFKRKEELKNKRYRDYFKDLEKISAKELYVGNIDLNIENGKLEIPYRSTIRIGKVLTIGKEKYYLVVNYNIDWNKELSSESILCPKELMIINSEGYWLENNFDPTKEWGHSIIERKDETFFRYYPDVWKKIVANKKGKIKVDENLLIYDTFKFSKDKEYYGVMFLNKEYFESIKEGYRDKFILTLVQVSIISALISIIIGILLGERIENRKKIEKEAKIDLMTGAYNRNYSFKILMKKLEEFKKNKKPLSIVYIDINELKYVNDNFGHHQGDFFIKSVCKIIKENVRLEDIFGRVGGDEFILILPGATEEKAKEIIGRILNYVKDYGVSKKLPYPISFAYGIIQVTEDFITTKEVLKKADKEMYRIKKIQKSEILGGRL